MNFPFPRTRRAHHSALTMAQLLHAAPLDITRDAPRTSSLAEIRGTLSTHFKWWGDQACTGAQNLEVGRNLQEGETWLWEALCLCSMTMQHNRDHEGWRKCCLACSGCSHTQQDQSNIRNAINRNIITPLGKSRVPQVLNTACSSCPPRSNGRQSENVTRSKRPW